MKRKIIIPLFLLLMGNILFAAENEKMADASELETEISLVAPAATTQPFSEDPLWIDETADSVYRLEIYDDKDNKIGVGSGFVMYDPPVLVTACHVIVNMDHMLVYGENGDVFQIDTILDFDQDADLAVLLLPETAEVTALEAEEETALRGEKVTVIGSQFGIQNLVTMGNVCGLWTAENVSRLIFSAPVSSGSSGGPVLNDRGHVIGIVSGTYDQGQNLNLAALTEDVYKLYPTKWKEE